MYIYLSNNVNIQIKYNFFYLKYIYLSNKIKIQIKKYTYLIILSQSYKVKYL